LSLDLAIVDYWASSGRSPWHRASAASKLALAGALLGASVFSSSLPFLVGLFALLWAMVVVGRLPAGRVALLAAYPALFSLIFIASRWDGTWTTPLVFLARSLNGGLAAIWLVGTTPYPDLFAPLSRIVPPLVGDALFLTYRAFFTIAEKIVQLAAALRLRGGLGKAGPRHALANVGQGLGTLVVFSAERSQRVYAVMALRGHSGRICGCRHWREGRRADWLPATLAVLVVAAAVWVAGKTP
jgi:cobalt/nickel transport system permease protein